LRFPYFDYNNYSSYIQESIPNCFHLDNLILRSKFNCELEANYSDNYSRNSYDCDNNYIIDEKQSLIIIPYITTVKDKGGGTVVIEESHKKVQEHIITKGNNKIEKLVEDISDNLTHKLTIKEITAEQGDVLIMHPYLIHSSSYADINSKPRILFNLSVQTK
jgi:ectoine hydroxylase-related dioxygenase (phytanoyl-CoA dioxygenase family)